MRRFLPAFVLVILMTLASLAGPVMAQLNGGAETLTMERLFPGAAFDPSVPTQEQVTGVVPGRRPLTPEEVVAYFRALAAASPRAALVPYAVSYEGRPLFYLAVGPEDVVSDLEGFRAGHRERMDPRRGGTPGAEDLVGERAVAWIAYGIHGDELSSSDAAAAVAYRLIAGTDPEAEELRARLLILIDPCENPDGRGRYLAQIASFAHRTANPDQDDLSHAGVWPWGRGNHYLFDMNRDWFTQVLPESRRATVIAGWVPQMMVDSHEMGSDATYLFPPPRHPFNPFLPRSARTWERPFSDDQAHALDGRGYPYFTGEWNEEFFPGYGSSWASYLGAVGILYEMSRTTGTLVRKRDGTVRTFAQAIEHHTTSTMANLKTLAAHAPEVMADQIAARADVVQAGRKGWLRSWIFPPDPRHPGRTAKLAALLRGQDLEVEELTAPVRASGLTDARTGERDARDLPAGTLLVRMDQPNAALARVILDPHVPMDEEFFHEERQYLEKGKGSRLYETTAWSVPVAMGVPAYWSGGQPRGKWRPWQETETAPVEPLPADFTSVIIDGDPDAAPAVLVRMLEAGLTVRVARKPVTIGGRSWNRGALVVRAEGNPADTRAVLADILPGSGLQWRAVTTARAESGPDLGGAEYPVLVPPRVAVLSGMPVSTTDFGAVWHMLDQDLDLRFTSLDIGRFGRTDLSRYNVIVLPAVMGGVETYRHALGPDGLRRLKTWITAGGTAVGLGGGARLLASPAAELTRTRFRTDAVEEFPPPVWSLTALQAEAAGRPSARGLRPGAVNGQAGDPYDVAPVFGPGARPFLRDIPQGTPLGGEPVAMSEWLKPVLPEGRAKAGPEDLQRADARLRRFMPQGALLAVELDPEHWLNFGLGTSATVWFGRGDVMVSGPPAAVAARFEELDRLQQGGLLWPEAAARMARTAYAVREQVGRGQVILFAGPPVYRRWMKDTERMFLNALLLGPGLGARWSAPW